MYSAFPQSERQGRVGISARYRIFIAILILGAYAQIAQAILIREGLVVFYGNEISLGAFYGSWLFWIAVGSLLIFHWRDRPFVGQPQVWVRRLLLLTPAVLLLQVLLLRLVRLLLNVSSSEVVPLGELFLSLFLITTPGSLLLGLAFPLACKALHDESLAATKTSTVRDVSWLYVADALGALSGGVLFTFVFIRWLGLAATLGLVALSLAFAAGLLLRGGVRRRWPELLLAAVGLLILLPPSSHWLGWQLDRLRFHTLHPRMELLDSLDTRYGHLELARLGEQVSVIRDGQISQSFPLPREVQQQAAYLMSQAEGARHLLVFGGSASGLVTELLRYPVDRIDLVEQDRRARSPAEGLVHGWPPFRQPLAGRPSFRSGAGARCHPIQCLQQPLLHPGVLPPGTWGDDAGRRTLYQRQQCLQLPGQNRRKLHRVSLSDARIGVSPHRHHAGGRASLLCGSSRGAGGRIAGRTGTALSGDSTRTATV
jgi:spermidine synthase